MVHTLPHASFGSHARALLVMDSVSAITIPANITLADISISIVMGDPMLKQRTDAWNAGAGGAGD